MLTLEELKKDREIISSIDWDITPDLAVRLYLEWGNIAAEVAGGRKIRITSKNEWSVYFAVNCWERPYYIYLIKRNGMEAIDLAKFELPKEFEKPVCQIRGIYPVEGELRTWLMNELGVKW
jgi:hypothetical protein